MGSKVTAVASLRAFKEYCSAAAKPAVVDFTGLYILWLQACEGMNLGALNDLNIVKEVSGNVPVIVHLHSSSNLALCHPP